MRRKKQKKKDDKNQRTGTKIMTFPFGVAAINYMYAS